MKRPFAFASLLFLLTPNHQSTAQNNRILIASADPEALNAAIHSSRCCPVKSPVTQEEDCLSLDKAASFDGLNEYLGQHLEYPAAARKNGIEGEVIVEAMIGFNGKVLRTGLISGLGFGCDEAVLLLISQMPDWLPAIEHGRNVAQKVILKVRFQLR